MVGSAITGTLESAEDQAHLLLEAEEHPYALDHATVARLIRVYSKQAADLAVRGAATALGRRASQP